jgi:hypothetical protein
MQTFFDGIRYLDIACRDASASAHGPAELVYHTLNRANGRSELFSKPEDHAALTESFSMQRLSIRKTLAFRPPVVPNAAEVEQVLANGNPRFSCVPQIFPVG